MLAAGLLGTGIGCSSEEIVCNGESTPVAVENWTMTPERYNQLEAGVVYVTWESLEDLERRDACRLACGYFATREDDDSWDYEFYQQRQAMSTDSCVLTLVDDSGTLSCSGSLYTLAGPNDPC